MNNESFPFLILKYFRCIPDIYDIPFCVSGIGKAIATDLALRKGKVYMLCRDMVKCEVTRKEIVLETQNK